MADATISGFELDDADLAAIEAASATAQPEYADPLTGREPTEDEIRMPTMDMIRQDVADAAYASMLRTVYVGDASGAIEWPQVNN